MDHTEIREQYRKVMRIYALIFLLVGILIGFVAGTFASANAYTLSTGQEVSKEVNEIIEQRTEKSQTFDNGDGTYTLKQYFDTQFLKEGEVWKEAVKTDSSVIDFDLIKEAKAEATSTLFFADTMLWVDNPNTNYNTVDSSYIGDGTAHRILQITTPNITGTIAQAKLYFYRSTTEGQSMTLGVYPLTRTDEVYSQATWNNYKTGSAWTTAGGDKGTLIATTTAPASVGWVNMELPNLAFNTSYHYLIKGMNNPAYGVFGTIESATGKPYLEIIYTPIVAGTSTTATSTASGVLDQETKDFMIYALIVIVFAGAFYTGYRIVL